MTFYDAGGGADDDVVTSHFHFFDEGTRSQMINLKSEAADVDVNVPAQHPKPTTSLHLHLWWETPLPAVKYNRETWRLLKRQTRSSAFLVNDNFNYRMCIHE